MFYANTRLQFKLRDGSPETIPGAVIAAEALPKHQLLRRKFKYSYLQHRIFDPQLYLATLDPVASAKSVTNLGSYPWFGTDSVEYDSDEHRTMKQWKEINTELIANAWSRSLPADSTSIGERARAAVQFQMDLECDAIILPGPLSRSVSRTFESETEWIDAGISASRELRVNKPVFATLAVSDSLTNGIDASVNPFLATAASQVGARAELAGAYIVMEQTNDTGYVCVDRDTLASVLTLVDDVVRGSAKRVVVNYLGNFGLAAVGAGAEIWASGYYRKQRRLRTADLVDTEGRAIPRYYSIRLAGDLGIRRDISKAFEIAGDDILAETLPAEPLHRALRQGVDVRDVPQWAPSPTNVTAASAHYNWTSLRFGAVLSRASRSKRLSLIHKWLGNAAKLARMLGEQSGDLKKSSHSDLKHQAVWLAAFEDWLRAAGLMA